MNTESIITPERVKMAKMSRFSPIKGLTPAKLVQLLDAFMLGHLREPALLFDAIERRDDVLQAVFPKRKGAIARRDWQALIRSDIPAGKKAQARAHQEALQFFYSNLTATNALDGNERGGFSLLTRQMMDAIGKKYAVHEVIWDPQPDGLTATLNFTPLWFFENRVGRLRFLPQDYALDGIDLAPREWMVTVGQGIMEACSVAYMFKHLSLRDWLMFSEKYGMPTLHVKTPAAKGTAEWDSALDLAENYMNDTAVVTGMQEMIELVSVTGQGTQPFAALVERMDRTLASLVRGSDLSTISADTKGASVQGKESELIERDDAQLISETLQMQLDRWVIEYAFGEGVKPLAYVKIVVPPEMEFDEEIKIDQHLINYGAPLGVKDSMERFGRVMPPEGEPLMRAPAKPAGNSGATGPGAELPNEAVARGDAGARRDEDLVLAALAKATEIAPKWLAPLGPVIGRLIEAARSETVTDAELLAMAERAVNQMPELAGELDTEALAGALEAALGGSVVEGLREAISENGNDGKHGKNGGAA